MAEKHSKRTDSSATRQWKSESDRVSCVSSAKRAIALAVACSTIFLTCSAAAQPLPAFDTPLVAESTTATAKPASVPLPNPKQSMKARELFRKGTHALQLQKSERATKLFGEAHRLDPGNGAYLAAYEVARQQRVGGMLQVASNDQKQGNSLSAKQQLLAALKVDPDNPYVQEHLQSLGSEDEPAVIQTRPMPSFSQNLIKLAPASTTATFHIRGSAQQIIQRVLHAYGVTALLDDSVPTTRDSFDLDNATFSQASTAVQLATGTFIVPLDGEHALIAKDTKENRTKFERMLLETIFLPGVDAKEIATSENLMRNVFGVRQVSAIGANGTLTVRAPESTLRAINSTLSQLYLDKPNVMLDIRIYQVSNSHQQTAGVSFPQTLSIFNVTSELDNLIAANQSTVEQLIASGLVNPGDLAGIAALLVGLGLANGTILNQPFALFGNGLTLSGLSFGSTTLNASLNVSDTRELDHIQLRTSDLDTQSFLVGSRYPIITQSYSAGMQTPTSFTSLASLLSGTPQSSLSTTNPLAIAPSVQYENLGLSVKAKTQVLQGNDVQIQLQLKITALSGGTVNGSPIINNRSFTTQIDIPNGGSALVTSAVSRTESLSLSGIPGLSELPGFGWTASPNTQVMVGKLLIVISPHIVSATHPAVAGRMIVLPGPLSTP